MKLMESIRRDVLETRVGGIANKFKLHKRRVTLFFEDISLDYIKKCEDSGQGERLGNAAQKWMALYFNELVPYALRKLPPTILVNLVIRKVWIGLGLIEDMSFEKRGNIVFIKTRGEGTTREIGNNKFMEGFYRGVLNILYGSQVRTMKVVQSRESCEYVYEIGNEPFSIKSKGKRLYHELNYFEPAKGFTLKDVLEKKILKLRENNRIYFRETPIVPIENTLYHIVGIDDILIDKVPEISFDYFRKIIEKSSTDVQKLTLLKNLLQAMGWGTVIIIRRKDEILLDMRKMPYGLQAEKDNWDFLLNTILGYLWLIDKNLKIKKKEESYKHLKVLYS